jgi:hypothetical protein
MPGKVHAMELVRLIAFSILLWRNINKHCAEVFIVQVITRCDPSKVNRRFRGTCCLHIHNILINQARKHHVLPKSSWILVFLIFRRRRCRQRLCTDDGWRRYIFILPAVIASNRTNTLLNANALYGLILKPTSPYSLIHVCYR